MKTKGMAVLICLLGWSGEAASAWADATPPVTAKVKDEVHPVVPAELGGILGERLDLWRPVRLPRVANDPFFLDGFAHRPGKHPWQGEHVGKWLHAATMACQATGDPELAGAVQQVAARLIASQEANGYLGTYEPEGRFYQKAGKGDPWSWDIWTHRYALYGLLSYSGFRNDPAAVQACEKAADLLAATVGPPAGDVTQFGTRHGLSSAVLLESIVMLYRGTGQPRYLGLAEHLVRSIESNPELRIAEAMRAGEDVTVVGDGKAYQLMAVLLGYLELYRCTGEKSYLETAVTAWGKIQAGHVNVAGGPWSYQVEAGTNHECFAPQSYFHPTCCVETCSTTTWIQLCLALYALTGESRYADEAEVAVFNQLLGAQSPNGNDWAYHSMLNMPDRGYQDAITCCASSGPRALELYGRHLICTGEDRLILNSYVPVAAPLAGAGGRSGRVIVEGGYPFVPEATIRMELPAPAALSVDFRLPAGARSMEVTVNGAVEEPERTEQGLFRLRRMWNSEDRLSVRFDFPLRTHFQTGSDGVRWVAFRWGPLLLAQTLVAQTDRPENVLLIEEESADGGVWLEPAPASETKPRASDDASEERDTRRESTGGPAQPTWRLKSPRKILLVPYFQAGSEEAGVRAMFPTRRRSEFE